ncbi:hypothetical protein EIP86_011004 [Pleurotus ostreatoroseus]|nr:hypothetical protein EIP86_011004 [Pleurotus ostreatoroseus]
MDALLSRVSWHLVQYYLHQKLNILTIRLRIFDGNRDVPLQDEVREKAIYDELAATDFVHMHGHLNEEFWILSRNGAVLDAQSAMEVHETMF